MENSFVAATNIDELKDQVKKLINIGESNSEITGIQLLREFNFDAECAIQHQLSKEFIIVLADVLSLHKDLFNSDFNKEKALDMLRDFIDHGTIFAETCDEDLEGYSDLIIWIKKRMNERSKKIFKLLKKACEAG